MTQKWRHTSTPASFFSWTTLVTWKYWPGAWSRPRTTKSAVDRASPPSFSARTVNWPVSAWTTLGISMVWLPSPCCKNMVKSPKKHAFYFDITRCGTSYSEHLSELDKPLYSGYKNLVWIVGTNYEEPFCSGHLFTVASIERFHCIIKCIKF